MVIRKKNRSKTLENMYLVNKIFRNKLIVNGKGDHILWEQANIISRFYSPWNSENIKPIEFRSLWDENKLFFCFKVYDSEIHIDKSTDVYNSINNSDRVELFFRSDDAMSPYYCLEIDPTPRIMDFMAKPNKDFNFDWNWPTKDMMVKSTINKSYFVVEGWLSIKSLESFDLLKNNKIEVGIYRAKYQKQPNGTYDPKWITWVNPQTEEPNFHISSSFGLFELVE